MPRFCTSSPIALLASWLLAAPPMILAFRRGSVCSLIVPPSAQGEYDVRIDVVDLVQADGFGAVLGRRAFSTSSLLMSVTKTLAPCSRSSFTNSMPTWPSALHGVRILADFLVAELLVAARPSGPAARRRR